MQNFCEKFSMSSIENMFESLSILETILTLTLESCLTKELNSEYYDLSSEKLFNLSQERNNYINMIKIALTNLNHIKKLNIILENEVNCYNKIPTIAADK